jgi:hypothetical protein
MATNQTNRSVRVPLEQEAVVFSGNAQLHGYARNVSTTGMLLALPEADEPAPFMRLQFKLGAEGQWIHADAIFARRAREGDTVVWGVQFVQLSPAAEAELEEFIALKIAHHAHRLRERRRSRERRERRRPAQRKPTEQRPAATARIAEEEDPELKRLYAEATQEVDDDAPRFDVVHGRPLI